MNIAEFFNSTGRLWHWLCGSRTNGGIPKGVVAMLPELKRNGAVFVDVRSPGEFAGAHAPGTISIPLAELGSRLSQLPKTSPVMLCRASGTRSEMAKLLVKKNGYSQVHNIGTWNKFLN